MQKNDLVLVITQPKMQFTRLVGKYCVILEVNDEQTHAEIGELNEAGEVIGQGAVPLDCLEVVTHSNWRK